MHHSRPASEYRLYIADIVTGPHGAVRRTVRNTESVGRLRLNNLHY